MLVDAWSTNRRKYVSLINRIYLVKNKKRKHGKQLVTKKHEESPIDRLVAKENQDVARKSLLYFLTLAND